MPLNPHTQAALLLTARFTRRGSDDARPLSPAEWSRLTSWLQTTGRTAAELVEHPDPDNLLHGWSDTAATYDRLRSLLDRGASLALAQERWERAGLWVIDQDDADYPARLKARLHKDAPPVLFGCGNRRLLNARSIAVVGSRNADENVLAFAGQLGRAIARDGFALVSGGARGIDQAAMLGALDAEGTALGILADSLLKSATSPTCRPAIMAGDLLLISPFNPEVHFDTGNAMARNKIIYCLSEAAVVVAADKGKGGTWHGATENLRHGWVPLWVRSTPDADSGNAALLKRGAMELDASNVRIEPLTRPLTHTTAGRTNDPNLFSHLDGGNTHPRA